MSLKSSDLYDKHDKLIQLKRNTYDQLYKRCVNIIKLTSKTGELMCIFEIPNFLFGSEYPIINIPLCADYIINKLTISNSNIRASFIKPNLILIDWRRKEDMIMETINK
jgi:hypothetical protein